MASHAPAMPCLYRLWLTAAVTAYHCLPHLSFAVASAAAAVATPAPSLTAAKAPLSSPSRIGINMHNTSTGGTGTTLHADIAHALPKDEGFATAVLSRRQRQRQRRSHGHTDYDQQRNGKFRCDDNCAASCDGGFAPRRCARPPASVMTLLRGCFVAASVQAHCLICCCARAGPLFALW